MNMVHRGMGDGKQVAVVECATSTPLTAVADWLEQRENGKWRKSAKWTVNPQRSGDHILYLMEKINDYAILNPKNCSKH